jgi:putative transcriptional regulator
MMFTACLLPAGASADLSPGNAKLLVATEKVGGDIFMQTVVLLLHYDETGAIGLVINRPTEVGMDELVPGDDPLSAYSGPIYWGGPVQMNSLSALMKTDEPAADAQRIVGSVYVVPVNDIVKDDLQDVSRLRLFIGYAGWAPGQLDHEIARGSWHVVPASDDVVFAKDPVQLWKRLVPPREHRAAVQSSRESTWLRTRTYDRVGSDPQDSVSCFPDGHEILFLLVGEQPRLRYEAHAEWYLQGEARATTRRDIDCQVSILPVLELAPGNVEATTMNLANLDVTGTNPKFAVLEAHGRRTIAATTALMEHQWPMCLPQLVDDPSRLVRYIHTRVHSFDQKNPIAFLS